MISTSSCGSIQEQGVSKREKENIKTKSQRKRCRFIDSSGLIYLLCRAVCGCCLIAPPFWSAFNGLLLFFWCTCSLLFCSLHLTHFEFHAWAFKIISPWKLWTTSLFRTQAVQHQCKLPLFHLSQKNIFWWYFRSRRTGCSHCCSICVMNEAICPNTSYTLPPNFLKGIEFQCER